jgi:hypothetical protein
MANEKESRRGMNCRYEFQVFLLRPGRGTVTKHYFLDRASAEAHAANMAQAGWDVKVMHHDIERGVLQPVERRASERAGVRSHMR